MITTTLSLRAFFVQLSLFFELTIPMLSPIVKRFTRLTLLEYVALENIKFPFMICH